MPPKPKIDKASAKLAFNETLEHSARVAAFSNANFTSAVGRSQVVYKAEELAQRDLILLALSTRRLAELCELKQSLQTLYVAHVRPYTKLDTAGFYPIKKRSSMWILIGMMLHHLEFKVYKNDAAVKSLLGFFKGDICSAYKAGTSSRDVAAACYIRSDKGEPILFSISDFVRHITKFIEVAEDTLGDFEIYVGNFAMD